MPNQSTLDLFEDDLRSPPPFLSADGLSPHLTHKANLKHTRYGWLRLTPAYSVHLVSSLLDALSEENPIVLDPFCGTGTTALVCAERGIFADTTDINPFLVWLATTKTRRYLPADLDDFQAAVRRVTEAIVLHADECAWVPPLHQIEKWWDEQTSQALGRALMSIRRETFSSAVTDLLTITFCRTLIECANVSFGHQSMSFKKDALPNATYQAEGTVASSWRAVSNDIYRSAFSTIAVEPRALLCDSRHLTRDLPAEKYDAIITSPPYPNRMSYIRELRPYMYWLGYLQDGRAAGELDWTAIGGTWGCATSYVGKWVPSTDRPVPYDTFDTILTQIAHHSPLLSRYVHKYFYDMVDHIEEVYAVLKPGGVAHYVVGNSKFYDVMLPVEEIFAALFRQTGFEGVTVQQIRKRTSKKELFEYLVSARKP